MPLHIVIGDKKRNNTNTFAGNIPAYIPAHNGGSNTSVVCFSHYGMPLNFHDIF